jgi:hypothetical protein
MNSDTQHIGDLVSAGVIVGVLADWLPTVASLVAIIWTLIRIFEWVRWRIIQNRHEPYE